jgi:hypothetical protein
MPRASVAAEVLVVSTEGSTFGAAPGSDTIFFVAFIGDFRITGTFLTGEEGNNVLTFGIDCVLLSTTFNGETRVGEDRVVTVFTLTGLRGCPFLCVF